MFFFISGLHALFSALEVIFFNGMRYINYVLLTYLLTYLLYRFDSTF